jgi:streptomycin 6-kinase
VTDAALQLAEHAAAWGVSVETTRTTPTSTIAFGTRAGRAVVLKVVLRAGVEWRCGEMTAAFGGRGVVRVLAHAPGAALLERLMPGTPLAALVRDGEDATATGILAALIRKMTPGDAPPSCPTVEQWCAAFARYLATDDTRVPRPLVEHAQEIAAELIASQRNPALLHGDLQHYNVLLDAERGWIAIDPKGVIGELECELGVALRNPSEYPDSFATVAALERRLAVFSAELGIDTDRARAWAFVHAVLAAVWDIEDGATVRAGAPVLQLAAALEAGGSLHEFWA